MSPHVVSRAALLVGLGLLAGCQSWHAVELRPGATAFVGRTSQARMTMTDGTVTTLDAAFAVADSVLGTSPETGVVHRTPNSAIRTLEIRRVSKTRTAGLLVVHASFVITLIALVIYAQPHYRGAF